MRGFLPGPSWPGKARLGWPDVLLLAFVFGILYAFLAAGRGAVAPWQGGGPVLSLSPWALPAYAARSLLRMLLAFVASLIFSIVYGYAAAYNQRAQRILVPLLDILQSVPVLGFLAVVVSFLIGVFPRSLLGLELASIFAIFTSQAWNMTFSFYHSLVTMPRELKEVALLYRLNRWQRLTRLEIPASLISLVWNGMMSFGGSWFFLTASEALTVSGRQVTLPGLGSYLALAMANKDYHAMLYSLGTMVLIIVLIDQVFWRPMVAWSQKFKIEETNTSPVANSFILTMLRRSSLVHLFYSRLLEPVLSSIDHLLSSAPSRETPSVGWERLIRLLRWAVGIVVLAVAARYLIAALILLGELRLKDIFQVFLLGLATLLRVLAATALGALWAVPAGVAIGFSPRLSKIAQPLVQILASFPANMLFPFITILYLRYGISLQIGAVPLMMLGTQWYILFNVIAGAISIPSDLRDAATVFRLSGIDRWRNLILPGIYPSLITGAVTAAGGAWNASIIAEVVIWGKHREIAQGLGSYITLASSAPPSPGASRALLIGILVMSTLVVTINRTFWRRAYALADNRYHL